MSKNNNFYTNKVVYKPWGHEYVIYSDANRLAITFVKIDCGHKTSLHCHPQKKTGFIILGGKASVQIGIYKENTKNFKSLSILVFRTGLFHYIKAESKEGIYALEFETPYKKNDLLRFKDNYGRKKKDYEGKKFTKNLNSDFIKFQKPKLNQKYQYDFNNLKIVIEKRKNLKNFSKKDDNSTTDVLDVCIIDSRGQDVISIGEIVKSSTLKILSENFKIKDALTILRVFKKKGNFKKNNKLIS